MNSFYCKIYHFRNLQGSWNTRGLNKSDINLFNNCGMAISFISPSHFVRLHFQLYRQVNALLISYLEKWPIMVANHKCPTNVHPSLEFCQGFWSRKYGDMIGKSFFVAKRRTISTKEFIGVSHMNSTMYTTLKNEVFPLFLLDSIRHGE